MHDGHTVQKQKADCRWFSTSLSRSSLGSPGLLSSRSMVIVRVLFIAQPTTGIFKMDAFETHLKDLDLSQMHSLSCLTVNCFGMPDPSKLRKVRRCSTTFTAVSKNNSLQRIVSMSELRTDGSKTRCPWRIGGSRHKPGESTGPNSQARGSAVSVWLQFVQGLPPPDL